MEPATLVAVTVGLALLHLLLLGYLGSRRNANVTAVGGDGAGDSGGTADAREDAVGTRSDEHSLADAREYALDEDAAVVRCRKCGAENEHDYRYCRNCVAELPGTTPIQQSGTTPLGGVG